MATYKLDYYQFVLLTYLYGVTGAAVAVVVMNAAFAISYFIGARKTI